VKPCKGMGARGHIYPQAEAGPDGDSLTSFIGVIHAVAEYDWEHRAQEWGHPMALK
jgi:hypothetical protein